MTSRTTPPLWEKKTVEETMDLYADWAENYDKDVGDWGYVTPTRTASALRRHLNDLDAPILDFGCGTGLSGLELASQGYTNIHGTDISQQMLDRAKGRDVYSHLWQGTPGQIDNKPGEYAAITAIGVISMGAAPAEMLAPVLNSLAPGGLLAFSYNDATLPVPEYMDALAQVQNDGSGVLIFDELGDHLPAKGMKSRVYILEKT